MNGSQPKAGMTSGGVGRAKRQCHVPTDHHREQEQGLGATFSDLDRTAVELMPMRLVRLYPLPTCEDPGSALIALSGNAFGEGGAGIYRFERWLAFLMRCGYAYPKPQTPQSARPTQPIAFPDEGPPERRIFEPGSSPV